MLRPVPVVLAVLALAACSKGSTSDEATFPTIPPPDIPTGSFEIVDEEPCWDGVCRPTVYGDRDSKNFLVAYQDFAAELIVVWVPPGGMVDEGAYFVAEDGQVSIPAIHDSGKALFVRTPQGSTRVAEFVNGDSRCRAEGGAIVTHFRC